MKKKLLLGIILTALFLKSTPFLTSIPLVFADTTTAVTQGFSFLQSKQDNTGKITGYGGESQWAAIAFSSNNVDVSSIKNPDISLKEFLLNDQPASGSAATEWERHILAIVAINENPSDFGGVNYVQNLQDLANENQLGQTTLLNDDIFGLLALTASGSLADQTIKQDSLNFIITHQAIDGGFSWSADSSCAWCGSDGNDTAAAIQALQAAKNSGLTHAELDSTIERAKQYLLATQKADGGFAYDAFNDADGSSTAWALMALNALELQNSEEAERATIWLENNQENDGGFHWMSGYGSDTGTTSQALIALNGKSWMLHVFTPNEASPTPSPSPSPTPSPTTIPIASATPTPTPTPQPSNTPTPTPHPTPTPTPKPTPITQIQKKKTIATANPEVLGAMDDSENKKDKATPSPLLSPSPSPAPIIEENSDNSKVIFLTTITLGGIVFLILVLKMWENRKAK